MKNQLFSLCLCASVVALTGCMGNPVPTSAITFKIGPQTASIANPKNFTAKGIDFGVDTNGTSHLLIAEVSSVNDSNVIETAYSGQAKVIDSMGNQLNKAFENGATVVGKFVGAPK